jgi:hypothetical protein
MNREVFVYMEIDDAPVLVGRLWTRVCSGKESASLEYDENWVLS